MKSDTRAVYEKRILRVMLYIQNNLYEPLSLDELAEVACFSPYHFHRIFRGIVGETVAEHIRRLRLERAAVMLQYSKRSVTDLAFEAGYETVESFTRAFKIKFGINPSMYKKTNGKRFFTEIEGLKKGNFAMDVNVKTMEPRKVAFVRHIGPYKECTPAWNKLCEWAGPKGLLQPGIEMIGLCHDDPDVCGPEKVRYDACIAFDEDSTGQEGIGVQTIEGGLYAVFTHHGSYDKLSETYTQLCGQWVPQNGYEIRSLPSYEIYLNCPEDTPEDELLTDIYVPIEKITNC